MALCVSKKLKKINFRKIMTTIVKVKIIIALVSCTVIGVGISHSASHRLVQL